MKKNLFKRLTYSLCITVMSATMLSSCQTKQDAKTPEMKDFNYIVDQFHDVQILRYRVIDFEKLTLKQQTMLYYLSEAALQGRDIMFDQNSKHNLAIRRTLEAVYSHFAGDKTSEEFKALELYLKRVWFSNGIHHHYSADKFLPTFSAEFFATAVKSINASLLPLQAGETVEALLATLTPVMFDPTVMAKRTNQEAGVDLMATSANNYYEGVTQAEVEAFYNAMKNPADNTPISYGLNSKLVKENGVVKEQVYKVGGMYGAALERVVYWLEKAASVAENPRQKEVIEKLIQFNLDGNLKTFDDYAVLWVYDTDSQIDHVTGFTETYGDPMGMKASWEALINFKNIEATERTLKISDNAQWFEDHSPIAPEFKKETVKGVSAKVITASMMGGDCYPATPLGINLPNANWIRRDHGSKSVTIENVAEAYAQSALGGGFNEEFVVDQATRELIAKYGYTTDNLHTDLHECLGHGSGKLAPGVDSDALRAYGAPIEEARADLFGLYYVADPKMVELGLLPDMEAYKAQYYKYLMNGSMTQLTRIEPGKNIEQAHMRNRQLVSTWILERGAKENIVKLEVRGGKTYLVVNNYEKLRELFGELLYEIQRIKSTGDFEAAKALIEGYAVRVNQPLHTEILERYAKLNLAPYKGFVNPVYKATFDKDGNVTAVTLDYTEGYVEQHLRYSKEYSPLPTYN